MSVQRLQRLKAAENVRTVSCEHVSERFRIALTAPFPINRWLNNCGVYAFRRNIAEKIIVTKYRCIYDVSEYSDKVYKENAWKKEISKVMGMRSKRFKPHRSPPSTADRLKAPSGVKHDSSSRFRVDKCCGFNKRFFLFTFDSTRLHKLFHTN